MPNYLNPTIIELDDVNFEKIDFEPGTAVFKSADFAILDAGSMQKLNITVDRDGERYIKQLQGICYVDKWAIARHEDLSVDDATGEYAGVGGAEGPITNKIAPVTGTTTNRAGRGTEDYLSVFASDDDGGSFGLDASQVDQLKDSLNLKVDTDNFLLNTTQLEPLEYAYDNGTTKAASYRGEMRLSTRVSALNRGYEFYNPYDPTYDDKAVGVAAADGAGVDAETMAYRNVHGNISADGANTYEFLTEPKFKEDVVYIVDDGVDPPVKYSAVSDGTAFAAATDDNGNPIVFDELPGIQTSQMGTVASPAGATAEPTAPALTQSNNIMHINITRNEREFDIGQSSEAVDQRRERGTRNLISSIVFCQMVSRLFNTDGGDANLELQNVDFSSDKERQSGLFFVNIDDEDVQENGDVLPRVTEESFSANSSDQQYPIGYKSWLTAVARRRTTYETDDYNAINDAGDVNVQPESIAEYALRLEYLRDPESTIITDYDYDIDQNGQLTNDGFVLNFKRDSSGNIIYRDASGNEGALLNSGQFMDADGQPGKVVEQPLTAVNEEVKKVILGSGKDRTFTIANDILYKTLQAFNGEKRGRRALDEDGNHGKKYTFTATDADTGDELLETRTIENYETSEWFPPENVETARGTDAARVNGDKLDAEVEYWNFRTANNGDSGDADAADGVTPVYNTNEREYVPFKRNDKMMVYYTIDIFFQQKSLEEVSPEGLNALTVEGSTKVETGDVVTSKGRSPDFHNEKLNFVLEWVLTHQQQGKISKRNASESGYYHTLDSTDVHEQLLIQNGAHENSRKNVWVEGDDDDDGEEYWLSGDKPVLSYEDAVLASRVSGGAAVQYGGAADWDLPDWAETVTPNIS